VTALTVAVTESYKNLSGLQQLTDVKYLRVVVTALRDVRTVKAEKLREVKVVGAVVTERSDCREGSNNLAMQQL
jgi:hypothetical protein